MQTHLTCLTLSSMWRGVFRGTLCALSLCVFNSMAFAASDRSRAEAELQIQHLPQKNNSLQSDQIQYDFASSVILTDLTDHLKAPTWGINAGIALFQPHGTLSPIPGQWIQAQDFSFGPGAHLSLCHTPPSWVLGKWTLGLCAAGTLSQTRIVSRNVPYDLRQLQISSDLFFQTQIVGLLFLELHNELGGELLSFSNPNYGFQGGITGLRVAIGPSLRLNLGRIPYLGLGYRYQFNEPSPHQTILFLGAHL